MEETPQGRVFLTVHVPSPQLVITGAVHISQTLAPIGQLLGYDVTIVDPRTAFASIERFPDVKVIAEWPDVALPPLNVDHYTAFVALTHDPKIDDPALKHALARDCFYIGALGSQEDPCQARAAAEGGGAQRRRSSRASMRRSGLPSARCRRPRSPSRSWARSPRGCGMKAEKSGGGMKFGPVAPADALGATAVHSIRQGELVLKKGTLIGPAEVAALQGGRRQGDRGGAARAGRRVRGSGRRRYRCGRRRRGRARRPRLHRPLQSVRGNAPACWWSTRTPSTGSTASTRR